MVNVTDINISNYTGILQYGMNEYYQFIPRDIFISLLFTIIAVGIFIQSDGNTKITLGFLIIVDAFVGSILFSPILLGYSVVAALMGAYVLMKSFYG